MKYETEGEIVITEQMGGKYLGSVCSYGPGMSVNVNQSFYVDEFTVEDGDSVIRNDIRGGSDSYEQVIIKGEVSARIETRNGERVAVLRDV